MLYIHPSRSQGVDGSITTDGGHANSREHLKKILRLHMLNSICGDVPHLPCLGGVYEPWHTSVRNLAMFPEWAAKDCGDGYKGLLCKYNLERFWGKDMGMMHNKALSQLLVRGTVLYTNMYCVSPFLVIRWSPIDPRV